MILTRDIILKIKKFLFNRPAVFLLFLGLIALFSLFVPASAKAALPLIGALVGLAISVLQVIPIAVAIYAFIFIISKIFVSIAGWLLNVVTSPSFVSVSYTNPTGPNANLIIKAGLDITKNFVNLALVVILVYIAVAIALRLGENNAKRLFAKLIVVALLVNFAPLLVGLIVDASNIVMDYFLVGIKDGIANVLTQTSSWSDGIFNQIYGLVTFQTSIIARGLVMIILNFATGAALFLYAALFLFRYIAIWTIVILSPLAFIAWILPQTKRFWDMWWNNLVQWSVIGIPIAFFLYLGARAYEVLPALFRTQMQTAGLEPEVTGLLNQTFPYFVVLAFLYLGFVLGLSTSAMGAGQIIGWSKKAGGWATGRIWKGAKTWTEEKAQTREKVGKITQRWEEIPVARWFIPEKMRKYAEARPSIDEARKKLSIHSSPEGSHRAAAGDIYGENAAAWLLEVTERGDSNDWFKQHMITYGINPEDKDAMERLHNDKKYQAKMARLLQIARNGGYHNAILRGSPRLAEFAVDAGFDGYREIGDDVAKEATEKGWSKEEAREELRKKAIKRVIDESRPQHIKNYEEQDASNKYVIEGYMDRGRDVWQAMGGVKRGHLKPLEVIGEIFIETKFKGMTKEQLATLPKEQIAKAWGEHEDALKKEGKTGIFLYLDSVRAKEQGWTREKIIELATDQQITLPKKKKGTKSPTTAEAVGIGEDERAKELFEETQSMKSASEKKEKEAKKKGPPEPSAGI